MEINRRTLYNSLRMNWILNPSIAVETWQVEDYRSLPLDTLIERLKSFDISLDKVSFSTFADTVETPEELTDSLIADSDFDVKQQDQIYLIVFELWRRLVPENICLSIFCDELDHQIYLYDHNHINHEEAIQDAVANLQMFLDENTDAGTDYLVAFDYVNDACANDLECFLLDYIAEQIDNGNYPYATELVDGFTPYAHDVKWFDLLRARLLVFQDPEESHEIIQHLLEDAEQCQDLEFNLELLTFLVSDCNEKVFAQLIAQTIPLMKIEDDFQSLVSIYMDFFHRLDLENQEQKLQLILEKRKNYHSEQLFDQKDPDLVELLKLLHVSK